MVLWQWLLIAVKYKCHRGKHRPTIHELWQNTETHIFMYYEEDDETWVPPNPTLLPNTDAWTETTTSLKWSPFTPPTRVFCVTWPPFVLHPRYAFIYPSPSTPSFQLLPPSNHVCVHLPLLFKHLAQPPHTGTTPNHPWLGTTPTTPLTVLPFYITAQSASRYSRTSDKRPSE